MNVEEQPSITAEDIACFALALIIILTLIFLF